MAKRKTVLGLDIGSSAIKLVQLQESKKGLELANFAMAQLEPETIVEGEMISTSAVIEKILAIFTQSRIKQREVAISVSGNGIIIKMLSLPLTSEEEIAEGIKWDAEQNIPYAIDEVYIDHQVIRTRPAQGQADVLLIAAKKTFCDQHLEVVREAGLEPVVLDVDCFAVQNAFEVNYEIPQGETVVLLNIGASTINVNVLQSGITAFARDILIGGKLYTEELQKQLNVSNKDAEALKLSATYEENPAPEVQRVLAAVNETLAGEILRTLDYYRSTFSDDHLSTIYLSGGTARVPSLAKTIEMRTGLTVELMDPFHKIAIDPNLFDLEYIDQVRPMAAVAVGLALRRGGDK